MNARKYLEDQGWRGDGHSLDQTNKGLRKPLLVSKKVDVLGVGLNKHAAVSDQWWLRAFDEGLKNFGTGQQSTLGRVQQHGIHRGGLYGRFVKGEGVAGTFGEEQPASTLPSTGTTSPVDSDSDSSSSDSDSDAAPKSAPLKRKRTDEPAEKSSSEKKRSKEDTQGKKPESQKENKAVESDKDARKRAKQEAKTARRLKVLGLKSEGELTNNEKRELEKAKEKAENEAKKNKGSKSKDSDKDSTIEGKAAKASGGKSDKKAKKNKDKDSDKLEAYQKRAAEKGVSLETYMARRKEKRTEKADSKK